MKVVIDIPNSLYANLQKIQNGSIASKRLLDCVRNGTPLPKGHGRLIDADRLKEYMSEREFCVIYKSDLDNAPTVIDADNTESKGIRNEEDMSIFN